ncbi:tRNA pseudouridine(38-40) synthase TruA [Domibacillus epiphyticus]|uniref:tRNA pseudouridine synthase A n=1 Tax=Domibacillus epiphyticus TaxID=1714355 RepID=A0A1V2AAG0_9BACI|nr:tRNA pseudouridine(38-40) synthase TruA [Domibacillus epiphyticus]OMP67978.1 tRNA pseudouridine(38-40) synthase TruA [Domibacillus epiphyticus]
MKRIKCELMYDGSRFSGYQSQLNDRTVQQELEKALWKIHKKMTVKTHASGRTDAGVHALGQIVHFDTPLAMPADRWARALNGELPQDISVKRTEEVPDSFHARYSVTGKEYRYRIYRTPYRDPFRTSYAYHYPYPLDVERMKKAAAHLIGEHDFTSFCSAKTDKENKVRTVTNILFIETGNDLEVRFTGNGFLYNMVRIMVGTLIKVGNGRMEPEDVAKILADRNRQHAGQTAPAAGLYLWQVFYDN